MAKSTKSLNATDIVSVTTAMNVAKRIRKAAFQIGKGRNVPIKKSSEIGIKKPSTHKSTIEISLTLSPKLMAFEKGSGIHSTDGDRRKYPILPKNKKALAFYENARGTWDYSHGIPKVHIDDGRGLFKKVMHPGVEARPFLAPAIESTKSENRKEIREEVGKNIRLIIKGMARTVK